MKIKKVHINSKGCEIKMLHQNSADDDAILVSFEFTQIQPATIQKALDSLEDLVCKIMNLSDDEKERLDIKGIGLKYNLKNTGVQISSYLRKNVDSGLGASLTTPMLYDVNDDEDLQLPEKTMDLISDVRNVAVKFLRLKFDQIGLFSNLKHDEEEYIKDPEADPPDPDDKDGELGL